MNKPRNHPLEDLLEIEGGSTPTNNPLEGNPFADEEVDALEEIDEEEFYKKNIDTSLEDVMANAPAIPIDDFYDDIDKKNQKKFQEVYDAALQAFGSQVQEATNVEGRFRARNLEVAAQFLRIGLDSAKDSANQKANKDKQKTMDKKVDNAGKPSHNNFFLGDRNDLLKALGEAEAKDPKVINDSQNNDE